MLGTKPRSATCNANTLPTVLLLQPLHLLTSKKNRLWIHNFKAWLQLRLNSLSNSKHGTRGEKPSWISPCDYDLMLLTCSQRAKISAASSTTSYFTNKSPFLWSVPIWHCEMTSFTMASSIFVFMSMSMNQCRGKKRGDSFFPPQSFSLFVCLFVTCPLPGNQN